jgi:hypothetical protein
LPFFAGAVPAAVTAATQAMTKEMIKRRMCSHSLPFPVVACRTSPRRQFSNRANTEAAMT